MSPEDDVNPADPDSLIESVFGAAPAEVGQQATLAVLVPAQWAELELDPDLRDEAIEQLATDIVGMGDFGGKTEISRAELVAYCRSAAVRCHEQGGLAAFFYSDVMDEEPYLLSASLIISYHLSESRQNVSSLATELRKIGGVRSVDSIRIDDRQIVRTRVIRSELAPTTDDEVELAITRYFLPIETGGLLICTFSTANVDLDDPFVELFDEIVSTVEFDPGFDIEVTDLEVIDVDR